MVRSPHPRARVWAQTFSPQISAQVRMSIGLSLALVLMLVVGSGRVFSQVPIPPQQPPPVHSSSAPTVEPKTATETGPSQIKPLQLLESTVKARPELFQRRFSFKIAPKTPLKELLPVAPKTPHSGKPRLVEKLSEVPALAFQAAPPKKVDPKKAKKQNAHQIAKIQHLNQKETDAFMKALLKNRPVLSGLPFQMGKHCRMKRERGKLFRAEVETIRTLMQKNIVGLDSRLLSQGSGRTVIVPSSNSGTANSNVPVPIGEAVFAGPTGWTRQAAKKFWRECLTHWLQKDAETNDLNRHLREQIMQARVAALMQILAPESKYLRIGLARYLATVPHVDATKALAKLVLFSPEAEVREAALAGLKVRRDKDYLDFLVSGLRYPWPDVPKRAAEAIVKLKRKDLIPKLVDLLDDADPRMPVSREKDGEKVYVVRQLVRINHHRNCLLCHSPGNETLQSAGEVLVAQVPTPGEAFPSTSSGGYGNSAHPDLLIRTDVTYLRQDFSAMLPVDDADPWPEKQRFDFIVQTRHITKAEADAYQELVKDRPAGYVTPYQRAVLYALRELTHRDTAPTAEAWRRLLGLEKK